MKLMIMTNKTVHLLELYVCILIISDNTYTEPCPTLSYNSLAPGKIEWNFRYLIFQMISVIDGWGISWELALRWMSLDLTDDKSTLVQVMAWCRQATSHYLSQCWPRSLSPYGVTRPQWVKHSTLIRKRSLLLDYFVCRFLSIHINHVATYYVAEGLHSMPIVNSAGVSDSSRLILYLSTLLSK